MNKIVPVKRITHAIIKCDRCGKEDNRAFYKGSTTYFAHVELMETLGWKVAQLGPGRGVWPCPACPLDSPYELYNESDWD